MQSGDEAPSVDTAGPREPTPQWRTRRTHSQADMMKVYQEIFFAGFPSSSASSGSETQQRVYTFPESYVRSFFEHYGTVEKLVYDERRGMGSVTFSTGDAAEHCYLAVHLSLLAPPGTDPAQWEAGRCSGANGQPDLLLCLEFAQCCPFVNTLLLRHEELGPSDMSRRMMRTFPLVERSFSTTTAEMIVLQWTAASEETAEASRATAASTMEAEEEISSGSRERPAGADRNLRRVGPHFPGGVIEPAILHDALWRCLRPDHIPAVPGSTVTVLDLWWEYYQQYWVRKTQPDSARIRDPLWIFAQRASVIQEIREAQEQMHGSISGHASASTVLDRRPSTLINRLIHDDTYHSVCSTVVYSQQLRLDPTWASLMRDLYTPKVVAALETYRVTRLPIDAQVQHSLNHFAHQAAGSSEEADAEWLKLSVVMAAANVIDNVRFLQKCRWNLIAKDGTENTIPTSSEVGLSTPSLQQLDESLYWEVVKAFEEYATSGTATSMLSICEDPRVFCTTPGHIGFESLQEHYTSNWRVVLNTLWVPLLFLASVVLIIVWANWRAPGRSRGPNITISARPFDAIPSGGRASDL